MGNEKNKRRVLTKQYSRPRMISWQQSATRLSGVDPILLARRTVAQKLESWGCTWSMDRAVAQLLCTSVNLQSLGDGLTHIDKVGNASILGVDSIHYGFVSVWSLRLMVNLPPRSNLAMLRSCIYVTFGQKGMRGLRCYAIQGALSSSLA